MPTRRMMISPRPTTTKPVPSPTNSGCARSWPTATGASARRIHLAEDWTATVVGLALVTLGLLSLLPEWLVA